ncbi:hypothetical protein F0562_024921 [Nyssa sinensis]|uniref:Uncharacterized protein n=1 Tax=Nyssa sinensis TaxID=561372 RepID=A0A5J5BII8_9ASTE|nr:hypothetical protein F0562_024921 [Nyssa sinensis]
MFICIDELKAKHGLSYVFTTTTSSNQEEVDNLVWHLSPNAKRYSTKYLEPVWLMPLEKTPLSRLHVELRHSTSLVILRYAR